MTYNGKEHQKDLGLNWHDFSARQYDAAIGRWTSIDPHSDSYFSVTPYSAFANNPILFTDPTGKDILFWQWQSDYDGGGEYKQVTYDKLNKATQKALAKFVKTDAGKNFLGLFANKGDKIGEVEFESDGKYSKHNLNLNTFSSYGSAEGTTDEPINNILAGPSEKGKSGPSYVDFYIGLNLGVENPSTLNYTETIGHEAFLHTEQFLDDYISAFENNGHKASKEVYAKHSKGNPSGAKDHLSLKSYKGKARKYYTFINQLKSVFNPREVQKHVNKERKKNIKHGKSLLKKR